MCLLLNCLFIIFVTVGKTASQVLLCFVFHITNAYLDVNFSLDYVFYCLFHFLVSSKVRAIL